jgi:hypothetical protein
MWLVLGKILYDSSCLVRGLFWLFISVVLIVTIYNLYGLLGTLILLLILISPIIVLLIKESWFSGNNDIEESQKVFAPSKTRELTYEEATIELGKVLGRHPDAVGDTRYVASKSVYRVYWLAIGNKNNASENKDIDIHFAISEDLYGMKVSFTNICDNTIEIEWPSFRIDNSRVYINGVDYLSYPDRRIEPGETVMKLLQPVKLKEDDRFKQMFDLNAINKEEFVYHVTFNAKVMNTKQKYAYDVHTKMKLIYKKE